MADSRLNRFIGSATRRIRENKAFLLKDVADKLGVTHQQLSKYERGESRIPGETLFHLSEIYNVPLANFFPIADSDTTLSDEIRREVQAYPEEIQKLVADFLNEISKFIHRKCKTVAQDG
jgi:transcriptional regulator with XRE-family HTH domain